MVPEVGTEAPDFTLKDQNNQVVTLSSFRGDRNVLVVFYPFAFSGICTGELCAVRDDLASFQNADVQILAVSVDHPFTLKAWSDAQGYEFPLLADFWPHGKVAQDYGVFNEKAASPYGARSWWTRPVRCGSPRSTGPARPATRMRGRRHWRRSEPSCREPGPGAAGRVAQRESTRLTPERSQVRSLPRPPV